ncbi:helix-turn-helix domain-containing protein [Lactiplantibacillus nangangensis]|uniref:Helix-turn-helix domain-containing protein n=1 Tax=Lactiplantibacillus nangangensis TaxID=2559917 RepID=A0ABW1SLQ5_9LACO|nr:helix-turn-helix transcriptional regulator [Lactiplantibacillus nangangensis]
MADKIVIYPSANVKQTLGKTLRLNRKTQMGLGSDLGYTQAMISKLVTGKSGLQLDQIQKLLDKLPSHNEELMLDILNQISGGIVPTIVSNHYQLMDAVNLDNRVIAECNQAIQAFTSATDELGRPRESVADMRDPYEAFYQGYDVIKYLYPFLIAVSNYLGCSMQDLAAKREKVLKQNSYKLM